MTTDEDILWRTLYGEARGEGREGMEAVASVILNRSRLAAEFKAEHGRSHPLYGNGTVSSACLASYQFSCWNPPAGQALGNMPPSAPGTIPSISVAQSAMAGAIENRVDGATHYHTIKPPREGMLWPPKWTEGHLPVAEVGRHVFYNLGMSG